MKSTPAALAASRRWKQSAKGRLWIQANRRRYEKTPQGLALKSAAAKRWYKTHAKAVRHRQLLRQYGLTIHQFNDLLSIQGYCCAICKGSTAAPQGRDWAVDHDHKTGKVRGLLCQWCNVALGAAKDNPVTLRMMANYIEGHAEVERAQDRSFWGNVARLGPGSTADNPSGSGN
jgi:hypothetical protein